MNPELPPPFPEPPPLPRRKLRLPGWLRIVLVLAALLAVLAPLRTRVDFTDDAGRVPAPFEVTVRTFGMERTVMAKNGSVHLLPAVWRELEVTDEDYIRSTHPVSGLRMRVTIERNFTLKLRQAAIGSPSVPQRGDPDPATD